MRLLGGIYVGHSGHSIIIALMMGTEMVPETLDFNELTRLSAREEFIKYNLLIAQADDNRGSKTRLVTVAILMFRSQSRPELVPRYY
jgi:hypothetical protein